MENVMAKLYFRHGAMGSSKTANALMVVYNYYERGKNALLVKPQLDTRGRGTQSDWSGTKMQICGRTGTDGRQRDTGI